MTLQGRTASVDGREAGGRNGSAPVEFRLSTHGKLNHRRLHAELLADLTEDALGVGTGTARKHSVSSALQKAGEGEVNDEPVHLVDEGETGNVVAAHLTVDSDGLRLQKRKDEPDSKSTRRENKART